MRFGTGRVLKIFSLLFVIAFTSAGALHSVVRHNHNSDSHVAEAVSVESHCHQGDNTVSESAVWKFIHCSLAHDGKKGIAILGSALQAGLAIPVRADDTALFSLQSRMYPDALDRHVSDGRERYRMFG